MIDEGARKVLLRLLRKGLLTQSEAARIAFVSRQAVGKWCARAGIDADRARANRVAEEFRRLMSADRKPSKAEQRREADDAIADDCNNS